MQLHVGTKPTFLFFSFLSFFLFKENLNGFVLNSHKPMALPPGRELNCKLDVDKFSSVETTPPVQKLDELNIEGGLIVVIVLQNSPCLQCKNMT
jgi:hypothetical protein